MKRVTEMKPREDLGGLKVLAAILNFDWESGDSKQLEKLKKEVGIFYWLIVEEALKDRSKTKTTQNELKTDLLPIFAPEGEIEPEQAYSRIRDLIHKLNEVESKTEWRIEPIDYELEFWESTGDPEKEPTDWGLRPLSSKEVESKYLHIHPSTELNLLGLRWYFGRTFEGADYGFGRETLYQIILDAFRSGAIARFRRCLHCKAFFIAEDARQQFCSDEHRNDFNNKQRLESGYFKKRRGSKRKEDLTRARKLLREGKSPTQIAKETGLSERVLKREGIVH